MRFYILQHDRFESLGLIESWLIKNGHEIKYTNFWEENYDIPDITDFDCLIAMGGSMSVNNEDVLPWIVHEKELIRYTVESGKKFLGICFGSQLLASAFGSKVYSMGYQEIGWHDIQFTEDAIIGGLFSEFESNENVIHWHGETFDLPNSAKLIASSSYCKNQIFSLGDNALGLQCHLEFDMKSLAALIYFSYSHLGNGDCSQTAEQIMMNYTQIHHLRPKLYSLLDKFFI